MEAAGLTFNVDGRPSDATHALALILTAQQAADLDQATTTELVAKSVAAVASSRHAIRARRVLHTLVIEALDQAAQCMNENNDDGSNGFEAVAHAYCQTRVTILERARNATVN